ncbi:arginine/serine-rich protein PNISR-like isoform X2 [Carassius auratus]|uniref:Arginine/serine-rich protein PNISR-like isoform X2 n=1 Tax=Carassius auratus TaxID=7957 RepID=A0A6P6NCP2_CARAU|nr:arginine/serine-rich protein PNISR-like isoform X2 [Carassius auratus]
MWDQGGQPWPQWPLSSQQQWMQSFQHQQDPGQVDWAALAQAWIAQKETTGGVPSQQGIQPNGQEIHHMEPPGHNNHGAFPGDHNFGRGWQPEWGMHSQPPPPPPPEQAWIPPGQGPMDVVNASEDSNSQDSLEFPGDPHRGGFPQNSHGFGGQPEPYPIGPVGVNQFDYQHGAAPTGTVYGPPSTGFHAPYWPEGPQNRRDRLPSFRPERPRSPNQMEIKPETPTLDAVKRRTLPAWIREGLEKMDREKQKKLEKERMEKERAEMANNERASDIIEEEGDGPRLPRKSKFDSDDEDGEEGGAREDGVSGRRLEFGGRSSPPVQEEQSEPEMTEEEKEFQLVLMTKTLLTEVLLEVTNEEIFQVAKETHHKATKAPAKQLAQSNALASLTGLGGLGEYGSDESEDEERSAKGSDSSDTDDEELLHRIRQKQDAFRRKEREQQERLALEVQTVKDLASDRVNRERAGYEEEQTELKHKQEVREREVEPTLERRRSRSEPEVSEVKRASKEHTGRNGGSASPSLSEHHSRTSSSSSSSSRYSSSSSSSASSRSSSRSSSPRRKRRRSSSASRGTRRRSRSRSSRRHQSERDKGRDRRRSSHAQSTDRSSRHRKRSHSRQRRSSRGRRSRSKASRSRSRERRRSRDHRRSRSRSRRKHKASSKDRDRRKERSRSHEKDKKKNEKDLDKKKDKPKGKEKEGEGSLVRDEEDNAKSRRKKESERTDSHSERFSRQDSKSSKKGSSKASKKYSDSESSRSRSPSPEVSKEKKSKKSKRSRSRSTERSHKSGKKASRKHKSKSRSRSASPSRRKR